MSNTISIDIPRDWPDHWSGSAFGNSALAGCSVEAEFSDKGELEFFDVSDGHRGYEDDLESGELYDAINHYLREDA